MVIDRFRECYESGDFAALTDVYAPDAFLDVNVPTWRLQQQGLDAIIRQYEEWFPAKLPRVTGWVERPTDWGAVVEEQGVLGEGDDQARYREVHLLFIVGDRIAEHVIYCTGLWDRATVARHQAEAPMIPP